MTAVYIGLGSNVGDRAAHLQAAVERLRTEPGLRLVRSSSVYETEPVGPPQRAFLNAAVEVATSLRPRELLDLLTRIEREVGRTPSVRWGPREIDLDILLYGEEEVDEPDLVIPHPRMRERDFVLVPLKELGVEVELAGGPDVRPFAGPLV